jgi:hypothetical protein
MFNKLLYLLLGIVLMTGVCTVGADMVILKSGEMFQTPRAWKQNGVVIFYEDGQLVRIPEKEVDRLIQSPAPVKKPYPSERRPTADPPASSEAPAAGQPTPSTLPTGDLAGHLDLQWGQPLAQFEGLVLVGTDPAYGGVQQYSPKKRIKRFGRARVDNIFYGFWQGWLYTILVETSNYVDFMELRAEAFRRFGQFRQEEDHEEKYRWRGKGTDRLLAYDFDSDTGYLWMRSQALHEKVKERYPE